MLQIVPRWQVDVILADGQKKSIWISDLHIENVLRQVAAIQFTADSLNQIVAVQIGGQHDDFRYIATRVDAGGVPA